jgi:hypothetical protein
VLKSRCQLIHLLTPLLWVLLCLSLAHGAGAQVPRPGQGTSRVAQQRETKAPTRANVPLPVFEFHSGFWINLHHVLYEQARIRAGRPTRRSDDGKAAIGSSSVRTEELTAAEASEWNAALDYYAGALALRDLLFDGDLVLIKDRLAELENCEELSGRGNAQCASGLRAEMIAALERAAPVYRARWWAEHDRQNRAWIAAVTPLVQSIGTPLATQLSLLYHVDWPPRVRVDVSVYAGLQGSYTSLEPLRITIASADDRNRESRALEVLFYEASHAVGIRLREAIAKEFRARGRPIPRELWTAVLAYTAAELARRVGAQFKNFSPALPAELLAARGLRSFHSVLLRQWQPYVERFLSDKTDPEDLERSVARVAAAY